MEVLLIALTCQTLMSLGERLMNTHNCFLSVLHSLFIIKGLTS